MYPGTLLINPLSTALVNALGWRNMLRVMAGLVFVVGLACVATFKPVKTPEQKVQTKVRHALAKDDKESSPPSEALIQKAVGSRSNGQCCFLQTLRNLNTGLPHQLLEHVVNVTINSATSTILYNGSQCLFVQNVSLLSLDGYLSYLPSRS